MQNIDEVGQISLLTTCTTKLHRYHRVTQYIFVSSNLNFREFGQPFYYLCESTLIEKDRGGHRKGPGPAKHPKFYRYFLLYKDTSI